MRLRVSDKMPWCWTGIDVNRAICAEKSGLFPLIKIATDNENSDLALKIRDSVDKKDNKVKNNNGKKASFLAQPAQNGTPDDEAEKSDWLEEKVDD